MSDFNWNNVSRDLEVINLLEERRKIEEKVKALDEFALVKYEYEMLGLEQANEDSKETEKALAITDVSSSVTDWLSEEYSKEEAKEQVDNAVIRKAEVYVIEYETGMEDIIEFKNGDIKHLNPR